MEKIKELFIKYKEIIMYIIFGVLTTIISWGVYYICTELIKMDAVPGNIISWILAVAFAYVTNRIWVFESKANGAKNVIKEAASFVFSRLATGVLETIILWLTVDIAGWNNMLMKIITNVIVTILNFVLSKLFVFRKKKD